MGKKSDTKVLKQIFGEQYPDDPPDWVRISMSKKRMTRKDIKNYEDNIRKQYIQYCKETNQDIPDRYKHNDSDRISLDSRKNWKDHIHHHIRVVAIGNIFYTVCDTCDTVLGKKLTAFYPGDDTFRRVFQRKRNGMKRYAYYVCNDCKSRLSTLDIYNKYTLKRCPNCDSIDLDKHRNTELYDHATVLELHKREKIRTELMEFVSEKEMELQKYEWLDNIEVILVKNPLLTREALIEERKRNRPFIVIKPKSTIMDDETKAKLPKSSNRLNSYNPKTDRNYKFYF